MKKTIFKDIPSVDKVLLEVKKNINLHDKYLKFLIYEEIDIIKEEIKNGLLEESSKELFLRIKKGVLSRSTPNLVNIINGTGIVLHTGFGRAPFNSSSLKKIAKKIEGYTNLEFNLDKGKRGDRQDHVRKLLSSVCESESSLVVNNNAAAVMLSINEIAKGGEVIVSRGELVEIGGSFRIPDIIKASGSTLREVGTTNRTHISDYFNAINNRTKLILKVHTSNYVVKGFTKSIDLNELVSLGKKKSIPVMVDWGSGSLLKKGVNNLSLDIPINRLTSKNPDLITFSGDKLIGGPQSGIIVGKTKIIDSLQKNTIYRTIRCDKLTIGLLEETLRSYRSNSVSGDNLALKMLATSRGTLRLRGKKILELLNKDKIADLNIELVSSVVEAGSGSLPEKRINSIALVFRSKNKTCSELAKKFRIGTIPVVGFINNNKFYIDLKAVLPSQVTKLSQAINKI